MRRSVGQRDAKKREKALSCADKTGGPRVAGLVAAGRGARALGAGGGGGIGRDDEDVGVVGDLVVGRQGGSPLCGGGGSGEEGDAMRATVVKVGRAFRLEGTAVVLDLALTARVREIEEGHPPVGQAEVESNHEDVM